MIQLVKAYNVFNNQGQLINPVLTDVIIKSDQTKLPALQEPPFELLTPAVAERMKRILIKTAVEGTGKQALVKGIEVGGKTGTAQISVKGHYKQRYNTSFIGFANDDKHHYTIGVTVVRPKFAYRFAAQSAAPVFRKSVEIMIQEGFLTPLQQ